MPAPPPVSVEARASVEAVSHALQRLDGLVDQEIELLRRGSATEFAALTARKHESLLELMRLAKAPGFAAASDLLKSRCAATRQRLGDDARLLKLHIDAVRELSELISDAIRSAESDGTYSRYRLRPVIRS